MADTNFKVWDENNNNVVSTSDFEDPTSQRGTGFVANSAASSSYVNSGLREGTLFATAFMQMIEDAGIDTSSANFASAVSTIQGLIENYINVKTKLYRHIFSLRTVISSTDAYAYFEVISRNSESIIGSGSVNSKLENLSTLIPQYSSVMPINGYILKEGNNSEKRFYTNCCLTKYAVTSSIVLRQARDYFVFNSTTNAYDCHLDESPIDSTLSGTTGTGIYVQSINESITEIV